jgi:hypothetical protein
MYGNIEIRNARVNNLKKRIAVPSPRDELRA